MRQYRRRITVMLVLGAIAPAIFVATRPREDITDLAALNEMPIGQLRESEVEALVRAAFRSAAKVTVQGYSPNQPNGQTLVIGDQLRLNELADRFAAGRDAPGPKPFFCPTLTYTMVRIEGPYKLDFEFSDDQRLFFFDEQRAPRTIDVRVPFSRYVADLLGLDDRLRPY